MKAITDTAKDYFERMLVGIFGAEKTETLLNIVEETQSITDMFREKLTYVTFAIGAAKNYGTMIYDIAKRSGNKKKLSEGQKRAGDFEVRDQDKKTLKDAGKFQTAEQKKLTEDTVEHHKDMEHMAGDTADRIQNIEISRDVFSMAVQTGEIIAQSFGVSKFILKPVTAAVKLGIDYAMYVTRVLRDRSMLEDYYKNTAQGKAEYEAITKSAGTVFGSRKAKVLNSDLQKEKVLDIICAGKGYENKDELVTDTGMKIATSIAFSASDFNPVMENKIMAATVMVVPGLRDRIGKTDSGTVNAIFDAMKAA